MATESIELKLSQIRRWRMYGWIFLFSYPFAPIIAGVITDSDNAAITVAILWFVMTGICGFKACMSNCPRCGNRFFEKKWYSNPFARKCLHCKLSLKGDSNSKDEK